MNNVEFYSEVTISSEKIILRVQEKTDTHLSIFH